MSIFDSLDRKIDNMSTMLTRFGIDPAEFAQQRLGSAFTSALRACRACRSEATCSAWLARTGPAIDRIPAFCPNAQRFETVKAVMARAS